MAKQNELQKQILFRSQKAQTMWNLDKFLVIYTTYNIMLALPTVNTAGFKITNMQCTALNQSLGEFKLCSLKAVKRDVVELNVHFSPLMKPVHNVTLLFRLNKRGNYAQKALYEFKVDVCAFLRSTRRNPLADLVYNMFQFQKYSNMNHSCPYDHDVILKGCRVDANLFNVLAIASGEYSIQSNWILSEKHVADITASVKID